MIKDEKKSTIFFMRFWPIYNNFSSDNMTVNLAYSS